MACVEGVFEHCVVVVSSSDCIFVLRQTNSELSPSFSVVGLSAIITRYLVYSRGFIGGFTSRRLIVYNQGLESVVRVVNNSILLGSKHRCNIFASKIIKRDRNSGTLLSFNFLTGLSAVKFLLDSAVYGINDVDRETNLLEGLVEEIYLCL